MRTREAAFAGMPAVAANVETLLTASCQSWAGVPVGGRFAAVGSGKAEASLLYQRVASPTPARRMPPEYTHKSLTAAQAL